MRVGLPHLGQSVLLEVSITFLRSAVLAILAMVFSSPVRGVPWPGCRRVMRSRKIEAKRAHALHAGPQDLFYNTAISRAARQSLGEARGRAFRVVERAGGGARSAAVEKSAGQRTAASD